MPSNPKSERILVVNDEETVRAIVASNADLAGYQYELVSVSKVCLYLLTFRHDLTGAGRPLKGCGSGCSAGRTRGLALIRSRTLQNVPRRIRFRVISANQRSNLIEPRRTVA